MIFNKMCDKCEHQLVCRNYDIIMKFDESAKKDLDIDITMESCQNFDAVQDKEVTD